MAFSEQKGLLPMVRKQRKPVTPQRKRRCIAYSHYKQLFHQCGKKSHWPTRQRKKWLRPESLATLFLRMTIYAV